MARHRVKEPLLEYLSGKEGRTVRIANLEKACNGGSRSAIRDNMKKWCDNGYAVELDGGLVWRWLGFDEYEATVTPEPNEGWSQDADLFTNAEPPTIAAVGPATAVETVIDMIVNGTDCTYLQALTLSSNLLQYLDAAGWLRAE